MYWPGMAEDIRRVTVNCAVCEKDSPAQPKETQLSHSIPKKPWEKVGMDLSLLEREGLLSYSRLSHRLL